MKTVRLPRSPSRPWTAGLAALAAALLLLAGCSSSPPPSTQGTPASVVPPSPSASPSASLASFPGTAGWKRQDLRHCDAAGLYAYLDGDADLYLRCGFKGLDVLHVSAPAVKGSTVVAEVYEMETPLQAFGAFSLCRPPKARAVQVGAEAFHDEGLLAFYQDRWMVKLFSPTLHPAVTSSVLTTLARDMAPHIPGQATPPQELQALPAEGLKSGTVQFCSERPLGLDSLPAALVADYARQGRTVTLAAVPCPDDGSARGVLQRLGKELASVSTSAPDSRLEGMLEGRGKLFCARRGRFVVCLLAPTNDTTLLEAVLDGMARCNLSLPNAPRPSAG